MPVHVSVCLFIICEFSVRLYLNYFLFSHSFFSQLRFVHLHISLSHVYTYVYDQRQLIVVFLPLN